MVISSMLRHLLNDEESLASYCSGRICNIDDIKRRMLLRERSFNRNLPDHYYRLQQIQTFDELSSLTDYMRTGLYQIANDYLELHGNRIHVKLNKFGEWHHLITLIPPLLLQSVFLHFEKPITNRNNDEFAAYKEVILLPNFRYTALPYPRIAQMESYRSREGGFHDLHMHLNGATETDIAWQDHLSMPRLIYHEMSEGFNNQKVKEHFEQESQLLDPIKYYKLLLTARKIRALIFDIIILNKNHEYHSIEDVFFKLNSDYDSIEATYEHPFSMLIQDPVRNGNPLAVESFMYISVFNYLA
jgi:hypothetical protein